jgi:hypothetical protein
MAIDEKAARESGDPARHAVSGQRFPLGPPPEDAGGERRGDSGGGQAAQVSTKSTAKLQKRQHEQDLERQRANIQNSSLSNAERLPLASGRPGSRSR